MSETTPHKKSKTRSPAYPSFPLPEAIDKISVLYEAEDRHPAPPDAISAHWNNSPTSSTFLQTISTLKQFGLLNDVGIGPKRQVSVSDLAVQIIESFNREEAVKTAALAPRLHAELWRKYNGRLPPKDESIRYYLLSQREDARFNKAYVDDFIAQFRATVAFAGLQTNDKLNGSRAEWSPEETDDEPEGPMQDNRDSPKAAVIHAHDAAISQTHARGAPTITQDFPLYAHSGTGGLSVPAKMSRDDFELIKMQINNSLAVIEATAVREAEV